MRLRAGTLFAASVLLLLARDIRAVPPACALSEEGFFLVRSDGIEPPRWIAPPSGDPDFIVVNGWEYVGGGKGAVSLNFSPDGRKVVYTDRGPGEDAAQIATIDVQTGQRRQLTHLPGPTDLLNFVTGHARFVDDETVLFFTTSNPDGHHPTATSSHTG